MPYFAEPILHCLEQRSWFWWGNRCIHLSRCHPVEVPRRMVGTSDRCLGRLALSPSGELASSEVIQVTPWPVSKSVKWLQRPKADRCSYPVDEFEKLFMCRFSDESRFPLSIHSLSLSAIHFSRVILSRQSCGHFKFSALFQRHSVARNSHWTS